MNSRKTYSTDVSDEAWKFVAPCLTSLREHAPQRRYALRALFAATRWMVKAACPWRLVPGDSPPWTAVEPQSKRWVAAGCFEALVHDLRELVRVLAEHARGRQPLPMKVPLASSLLVAALFCALPTNLPAAEPVPIVTFCNPLNLGYQPLLENGRIGADPVIVPFKGKYYLFDSQYHGGIVGYRVSDDLIHWRRIPFGETAAPLVVFASGEGYAPGVVANDGWIYLCTLNNHNVLRTQTPDDGASWELYSSRGMAGFDPAYYFEDGHLFLISGFEESSLTELDPRDFTEIPGTKHQVTPRYDSREKLAAAPLGLFQGIHEYEPRNVDWNKIDALDTTPLIPTAPPVEGQFNTLSDHSAQEAGWLTKYQGRYYLQNSTPGTACPWYGDTVYVADSIHGPYTLADYAPASMKVGGFINSSGHSCVFQDFHGNWWRVSTMWIGAHQPYERRLGLFPAGFDAQGRMFTQTTFGDYPMVMPAGLRSPSTRSSLAGWSVLSKGKTCLASSALEGHGPELASDENVRTWWSAKTGDAGEWFQMDLGRPVRIDAVQVNFAEQDWSRPDADDDYHAYRLLASADGRTWSTVADKSANKTSVAHDYLPLEKPLQARYLKVVNVHMARHGKFALGDLRVFGNGGGKAPAPVSDFLVARDPKDARNVTFRWNPAENCDGCMIRYGVAPDALHLSLQYQNPAAGKLTVSCLNKDVKYFYRLDVYNDSGVTEGTVTTTAQ